MPSAPRNKPASTKPTSDLAFTEIKALLEKVERSTFHRRFTDTSYEIRHDYKHSEGDYAYMVPFAELERGGRGTKLTFYPLLSHKKLRAMVTSALAAHALTNRKSFVFKQGINSSELADLAAIIELGSKIWYVEVSD